MSLEEVCIAQLSLSIYSTSVAVYTCTLYTDQGELTIAEERALKVMSLDEVYTCITNLIYYVIAMASSNQIKKLR